MADQNKCTVCGVKVNRKTTPFRAKHGSHTHVFCDQH